MSQKRTYTEKEAARIMRIAADIQHKADDPASGDGVSLDELARIGEEVGLDPKAIRLAADRLDDDGEEVQRRLLGAPPTYEIERIIDGPMTDDLWDAIVGELNTHYAQSVSGISTGRTRTWNFKQDTVTTHLTAQDTGKKVRLTMKKNIDDGIAVAMIPTIMVMLGAFFGPFAWAALRPWGSLLLGILFAATIGLLFRTTVAKWYRNDRKRANRLMDKLALTAIEAHEAPLETAAPIAAEEPETLENRLEAN